MFSGFFYHLLKLVDQYSCNLLTFFHEFLVIYCGIWDSWVMIGCLNVWVICVLIFVMGFMPMSLMLYNILLDIVICKSFNSLSELLLLNRIIFGCVARSILFYVILICVVLWSGVSKIWRIAILLPSISSVLYILSYLFIFF